MTNHYACTRFISVLLFTRIVIGSQECVCKNGCTRDCVLDCSYREKSILLSSDINVCEIAKGWDLKGNYIQNFQFYKNAPRETLDISENELGLGPYQDILREVSQVTSQINIRKNYIKTLNFLPIGCVVTTLNASNNFISEMVNLYHCQLLQHLDLHENNITSLPNNITFLPGRLIYFDLSSNSLHGIEEKAFGRGIAEMQTLLLHNNQISSIPENVFTGMVHLKKLSLAGNKLKELPSQLFRKMVALDVLHLQNNALASLPDGIFSTLNRLRFLNLASNQLSRVSAELFSKLHSLEELSLSNNRLKSIPSLHLCVGPLRVALFDRNLITHANETTVRALMRYNFVYGDLRVNPISKTSLEWTENSSDVTISWIPRPCGLLTYFVGKHGNLQVCYDVPSYQRSEETVA